MNNTNTQERLKAWKKSIDLVNAVYQTTRSFPNEDDPTTARLRTTAVSVSSIIAEGSSAGSKKQLSQYLLKALFSLNEMESQLKHAHSMGYIVKQDHRFLQNMVSECLTLTDGLRTAGRNFSG